MGRDDVFVIEPSGDFRLAVDGHAPRPWREAIGVAGRIAFVQAEFVKVVVGHYVFDWIWLESFAVCGAPDLFGRRHGFVSGCRLKILILGFGATGAQ